MPEPVPAERHLVLAKRRRLLGGSSIRREVRAQGHDHRAEEEPEERDSTGDADLCHVVEVDVVGMDDQDVGALQVEVVLGIDHPVRAPADAEERMVLDHRDRALPEGQAHLRRGVDLREDRGDALVEHRVEDEEDGDDEDAGDEHAAVAEHAVAREDDGDDEAGPARVRHREARRRREHEGTQEDATLAVTALHEEAEGQADDDVEVACEDVRVFPGREDALAQLREGIAVDPLHRADVDAEQELVVAVEQDDDRRRAGHAQDGLHLPGLPDVLPDQEIRQHVDADEVVIVVKAEPAVRRGQHRQAADGHEEHRRHIEAQVAEVEFLVHVEPQGRPRDADEQRDRRHTRRERQEEHLGQEAVPGNRGRAPLPAVMREGTPLLADVRARLTCLISLHALIPPASAASGARRRRGRESPR